MKLTIRSICLIGLFAAVIAVLSILTIPTPWGVPFTLQTFAVALVGYVLGPKLGTISTAIYVLIGFIGLPVYAGMKGGPGVFFGATGGYIYGFIAMTFLCGLGVWLARGRKIGIVYVIILSVLGLAACHILGTIQFRFVMNHMSGGKVYTLLGAAMVASVPYLLKDILSVVAAYLVALAIRRALRAAHVPEIMEFKKEQKIE